MLSLPHAAYVAGSATYWIGAEGLQSLFHTLLTTTSAAIVSAASCQHLQVKTVLQRLDIHATLRVLGALVEELDTIPPRSAAFEALMALKAGVECIQTDLESLKLEMNYHESKWFQSYRTPNYEDHLAALERHKDVMDRRLDLLVKVLAIPPAMQARHIHSPSADVDTSLELQNIAEQAPNKTAIEEPEKEAVCLVEPDS